MRRREVWWSFRNSSFRRVQRGIASGPDVGIQVSRGMGWMGWKAGREEVVRPRNCLPSLPYSGSEVSCTAPSAQTALQPLVPVQLATSKVRNQSTLSQAGQAGTRVSPALQTALDHSLRSYYSTLHLRLTVLHHRRQCPERNAQRPTARAGWCLRMPHDLQS